MKCSFVYFTFRSAFLSAVTKKAHGHEEQVNLWLCLDRAAGTVFMKGWGSAEPSEHCLPVPGDAAAQRQLRTPGDPPWYYRDALPTSPL